MFAGFMQAQLMMGIRPSGPPPPSQNRFQAPPIQRPNNQPPSVGSNQSGPVVSQSVARNKSPAVSSLLKAQQAKQRAELLQHAQSFLNPHTKAEPTKAESTSVSVTKSATITTTTTDSSQAKKEKESSPVEKK